MGRREQLVSQNSVKWHPRVWVATTAGGNRNCTSIQCASHKKLQKVLLSEWGVFHSWKKPLSALSNVDSLFSMLARHTTGEGHHVEIKDLEWGGWEGMTEVRRGKWWFCSTSLSGIWDPAPLEVLRGSFREHVLPMFCGLQGDHAVTVSLDPGLAKRSWAWASGTSSRNGRLWLQLVSYLQGESSYILTPRIFIK